MKEHRFIDCSQRDEEAAHWVVTLAVGTLAEHERAAFDRWLEIPENLDAFGRLNHAMARIDTARDSAELVHMRSAALRDFEAQDGQPAARWGLSRRKMLAWGGLAASIAVVGAGVATLARDPVHHYATGVGEQRMVMLADGSRLVLDGDSAVDATLARYRRSLVLTHGRARFDVAKDPLRPFTVAAGGRLVVATGTSFSVELLGKTLRVQLYEGHVTLMREGDGPSPTRFARGGSSRADVEQPLSPGAEAVAAVGHQSPAVIRPFPVESGQLWERGQLVFEDMPLADAIAQVNRYARRPIELADPATGRIRVNGVFSAGDVAAFLDGLSALHPVRVTRTDAGWRVERRRT
ncbi:FecR family protein [Sphingomonas sp. CJ20]